MSWVVVGSLVVSAFAAAIAAVTVAQRWRSDRRTQWWARVNWALDKVTGDEYQRAIGLAFLVRETQSKRNSREDRAWVRDLLLEYEKLFEMLEGHKLLRPK